MLRPLVGLKLDGATLAEVDEVGGVGMPAWGPAALLRDLELRLGLPGGEARDAVRVHQWSARLAALLATEPFYARSYGVDPMGTAQMLLAWRDGLIDSGWSGTMIPGGGARLAAFTALEAIGAPPLAAGAADRVAAVEAELALRGDSPYAELTFADDVECWPHRWQRIFTLLAERGTSLVRLHREELGAPPETDLGRLQALIGAGETAAERVEVRGDGSLVLLRAATTLEAAEAVAAMVHAADGESLAIVRGAHAAMLDDALGAQGAGRLGVRAASRWRAALQVLPLALEMLFEPCDPRRALELLGLAVSPFAYVTRYVMSRALSDCPGIGDTRWHSAKARLRERLASSGEPEDAARADRQVALVEDWFEPSRYDPRHGAPKAVIVAVATRVRDWLRLRLASGGLIEGVAVEQCGQLLEILASDGRDTLDRVALRQVLDAIAAAGATAELTVERAGRADHVDDPGALLRRRDQVIWWHFAAETARPPHRARWRRTELDALAASGVVPTAPARLLAEETRQWRAAVLAARHRLVLVLPETDRGERLSAHPLWDELVARLRLDDAQIGRITVSVAALLARPGAGLAVEEAVPLALPAARPAWRVPAGTIGPATGFSSASLQELLECPLRWVLGHAASLHAGSVPTLPEGALLNGVLGHRLLQALVNAGAVAGTREEITRVLDGLLAGVAASLLQPGMAFELHQLRHQLTRAIAALVEVVRGGELTIAATEEEIAATWLGAELVGRLDVRLVDRAGRDVIIDLKWGHGTYRDLLTQGRAVQLAAYAQARWVQSGAATRPAAGYFSLSRGRLLTTDGDAFGAVDRTAGPTLDQTCERIAATVPAIQRALAAGHVAVTGVRRSLPLLETIGVPPAEHDAHYASEGGQGCSYCRFDVVCGRAWERFA